MSLYLSGQVGGHAMRWPVNGTLRIGRGLECDVQLVDPTVSKRHAELAWQGDRGVVRDLGSRNGTRVNGEPVAAETTVHPGDAVAFGQVTLRIADLDSDVALAALPALGASLSIPAGRFLARPATDRGAGADMVHHLADVGRLLVVPRPLPDTCDDILAVVERAVPSSRTVLLLCTPGESSPCPIASRVRGARRPGPLVLSREIVRQVVDERSAVLVRDAGHDPHWQGRSSIVAGAVHTAIAAPLIDGEQVLGLLYVDSHDPLTAYGERELELLTLIANMAAVKITNARLLEAEARRARIEQELQLARSIQESLLPPRAPAPPGWRCHTHLRSCHEVGGDFVDWWPGPDGTIDLMVGDVSGKGMGAALLMSSVMTAVRMLQDAPPAPAVLAQRLNAMIHRSTDASLFVTAVLGRLDPAGGTFEFVNAGHPAPLLMHRGHALSVEGSGMPLGVASDATHAPVRADIPHGARLALFTDGFIEARRDDTFFGVEGLAEALMAPPADVTPEARTQALLDGLDRFLDGRPPADDLTLLLMERT